MLESCIESELYSAVYLMLAPSRNGCSSSSVPYITARVVCSVPENVPHNAVVGLPRRNLKLIPPGMQEAPKLQV
jgi:hypothetical protein